MEEEVVVQYHFIIGHFLFDIGYSLFGDFLFDIGYSLFSTGALWEIG